VAALAVSCFALAVLPARASERDITSAVSRDVAASGYTLPKGTWAFSAGLLGVGSDDAFASLGARVGVGAGFDVGANLAHVGVGMMNLNAGWMFLDSRSLSITLRFSPSYLHGDWVWIASSRDLVSGLDAWILPVTLTASSLATDWLQFDLAARAVDTEVLGNVDSQSLALQGQLAVRQISIDPGVRFHVMKRASFYARARLPLWTSLPGTATVEVQLQDGVVAGGRSSGDKELPFENTVMATLGARAMVADATFLDFSFNVGHIAQTLYGSAVQPQLSLETRF
jgi:hypothetical protein